MDRKCAECESDVRHHKIPTFSELVLGDSIILLWSTVGFIVESLLSSKSILSILMDTPIVLFVLVCFYLPLQYWRYQRMLKGQHLSHITSESK